MSEYLPPVVARLTLELDQFYEEIARAKAALDALKGVEEVDVHANADTGEALAKIAELKAAADALKTDDIEIGPTFRVAEDALISAYEQAARAADLRGAASDNWEERLAALTDGFEAMHAPAAVATADTEDMARAMSAADLAARRLSYDLPSVGRAARAADAALGGGPGGVGGAGNGGGGRGLGWLSTFLGGNGANPVFSGGGFWGLGGQATLWGGAATIGNLHVLLDGLLETFIALGSALLDLGLAAYAVAPAAQAVYARLGDVHTVATALGVSIPATSGAFAELRRQLGGQVVEAYGGALNLLSHNAGTLEPLIRQVVDDFDGWIAKLDIWMQAQTNSNGIVKAGLGFLHQFEQTANALGSALVRLGRADPGTAHYLLDLVDAAAKGIQMFSELPAPIVRTVLALHSLFLWGGLLVTILGRVAGAVWTMVNRIAAAALFLADNPIILPLAAIAAAIGYVAYQSRQLPSNVATYISGINQALANDNASTALGNLNNYIKAVGDRLPQALATARAAALKQTAQANLLGNDLNIGTITGGEAPSNTAGASARGNGWERFFFGDEIDAWSWVQSIISKNQANNAVNAYRVELQGLTKDQLNLFGAASKLAESGYSVQQSFALMDLAGVQVSDTLPVIEQKIKNLIAGYSRLSIAGSLLENSANAVQFASNQSSSGISTITQAYTTFISTVTGGESAFTTFQQGLATMATDAKAAGASMTGLNANSLTLASQFTTNITNASNLMNALYTLASASGLGAKGTELLTQAGRDMAAELLPMARNSSIARDELYALAQTAGYNGANSLKALTEWIGKVADPAKNLSGIISTLTGKSANLAQDVQNLSNALNPSFTSAMAQAIIQASGGDKVLTNFANAFIYGQGTVNQMMDSAKALAKQLITLYGNTATARNMFEAFAARLGITQGAADNLWNELVSGSARSKSAAVANIEAIKLALEGIQSKTITVTVLENIQGRVPYNYRPPTGSRLGTNITPNITRPASETPLEVHVFLSGREIYSAVQKHSVSRQRVSGSNGFVKRTH